MNATGSRFPVEHAARACKLSPVFRCAAPLVMCDGRVRFTTICSVDRPWHPLLVIGPAIASGMTSFTTSRASELSVSVVLGKRRSRFLACEIAVARLVDSLSMRNEPLGNSPREAVVLKVSFRS